MLDVIGPVIRKYNGIELEDILWIFKNSNDAVMAALACRKTIKEYNAD